MTSFDDRVSAHAAPSCGGHLVTQAEVDRTIEAITEYCKQTGRPLRDVATEILQGRLVIDARTLRATTVEVDQSA